MVVGRVAGIVARGTATEVAGVRTSLSDDAPPRLDFSTRSGFFEAGAGAAVL
jgi:hypothetical protein